MCTCYCMTQPTINLLSLISASRWHPKCSWHWNHRLKSYFWRVFFWVIAKIKWLVGTISLPTRPIPKHFLKEYFALLYWKQGWGRNNIVYISRDTVLTNQQLPSLYSSGVAKTLARSVWGKLHGNVWAESFKSWLCWFTVKFCSPWVVVFLQLAR